MQTTIQKWGNSLAVRIPSVFARDIDLKQGSKIEIETIEGEIRIRPIERNKHDLKELLKMINRKNLHEETETGAVLGNEIW